jgi:hypothetical protein
MASEMFVVRGVAKVLRQRLKEEAAREGITVRQAVSMAITDWLNSQAQKKKLDPKALLKLNGMIKGGKGEDWSKNIDKILYG